MDILILSGTPRAQGQTREIAAWVQREVRAQYPNLHTELYDLATNKLPLFGYEATPDEVGMVEQFIATVKQARAVIFCTPEYHHSLSGALKNAMDHLGVPDTAGKVAAVVTVGGGYGGTNSAGAMMGVCRGLRMWAVPSACSVALEEWSALKSIANPLNATRLKALLEQMVVAMERLQPAASGANK